MAIPANHAAQVLCEIARYRLNGPRLQHTLYIAHILHMGDSQGDLFITDRFFAAAHGPCLLGLRRALEACGQKPNHKTFSNQFLNISAEEHDYLKAIQSQFSSYDDQALRDLLWRPQSACARRYQGQLVALSDRDLFEEFMQLWDTPDFDQKFQSLKQSRAA